MARSEVDVSSGLRSGGEESGAERYLQQEVMRVCGGCEDVPRAGGVKRSMVNIRGGEGDGDDRDGVGQDVVGGGGGLLL